MILSFSHKHPKIMGSLWNQPTFFPEKILQYFYPVLDSKKKEILKEVSDLTGIDNSLYLHPISLDTPAKIHSIREDSKDRWRVGMTVHFTIFNRSPKSFQFYLGECVSIQSFEVKWYPSGAVVLIDGRIYHDGTDISSDKKKINFLALNDGFLGERSFLTWFSSDFKGKIIHWTNFKY